MSALDIIDLDGTLVVSSEQIAAGSGVQHKNVLELIDANRADFEDFGDLAFETRDRIGVPGPRLRVALLNEQQASLLMTYQRNTDQVRQFKKALIRAFFDMARRLSAPPVPQSLPDALRAYALEVEAREALEAKVAADAPKVLFADAVATSEDSILVGWLATILKQNGYDIGQNRLFERLREDGYLCKGGASHNRPTQRAMDMGLFEVIERTVQGSDGSPRVRFTTKVTGKGQTYFVNRYAKAA